ncbi:MAG: dienelactone hydrolase family protein [Candidatus Obscuribacterales bacterium]|nr:dienelactone hydrolase family protein [Candidatus Obscuribacterales bacterium]
MYKTVKDLEGLKTPLMVCAAGTCLNGDLYLPKGADKLVVFAHGSGSSRHSPRNQYVSSILNEAGIGTFLFDLLTPEEERIDLHTRHLRFDIDLLGLRMVETTNWLLHEASLSHLKIGYFGASTGAAAALLAAAYLSDVVYAVVSRGGRPDLAGNALSLVNAPTLLIVGGLDEEVIKLNKQAFTKLSCEKELAIVPGATHLFEEPGTLERAAALASNWFSSK